MNLEKNQIYYMESRRSGTKEQECYSCYLTDENLLVTPLSSVA